MNERAEVEEPERWWRRVEGAGCEGPDRRWLAFVSVESGMPLAADVEDELDVTEALEAVRSRESSRVRRLT